MKNTKIKIGEKKAMGIEILLNNAVLVMAIGKKGFVMCGYLNVDAAEKMGDCACVVKGVKNVDELLAGEVVALTTGAQKLGIELGITGKKALEKLA
ncbi:MAG: DUF1805 domain-containing protein [Elusimicrobia bacterium CG06_land_8_20_14_3_00_38_11]|nr:MAG: DUF1805 domain-containing protein [Elusimicrobia bacterium CG06_land_8_20_14_3_00_38_11]